MPSTATSTLCPRRNVNTRSVSVSSASTATDPSEHERVNTFAYSRYRGFWASTSRAVTSLPTV